MNAVKRKLILLLSIPALSLLFLSPGSPTAQTRKFELSDDATYHYRAQLYGGWGADQKPIPPLGVQMRFDERTFDFPCCPNGPFLNSGAVPPNPGSGVELNGFTLNPESGSIGLYGQIIFFNRASSSPTFTSNSNYRAIVTQSTLLPTPENDKNRRYILRFHLLSDFSIRFEQAPFDLTSHTYPSQSDFVDSGGSDSLRTNLYSAILGKIQLPGGLPVTVGVTHPGATGSLENRMFYLADGGWQNHYDIVAQTQINGTNYNAGIPYVFFLMGDNSRQTTLFFNGLTQFPNVTTQEGLHQALAATTFSFRRKSWGSLHSGQMEVCMAKECEIPLTNPTVVVPGLQIVEPGPQNPSGQLNPIVPLQRIPLAARRYLDPILNIAQQKILAPARLSFRLRSSGGGNLSGVSLKISARRKGGGSDSSSTFSAIPLTGKFHRYFSTIYDPQFDGPLSPGGLIQGIATVDEERQYLKLDDVPGTEYEISCDIVFEGRNYSCSTGGPGVNIRSLVQIRPSSSTSPERRVFLTFPEAFSSYRVGMPYTTRKYDPTGDAYPLFEIEFMKPNVR